MSSDFVINNYIDGENDDRLYELLGFDTTDKTDDNWNISDAVLEAKILSMINQYKTAKANSSGNDDEYDKVITFMIDIYKHFFDTDIDGDGKNDRTGTDVKKYESETDVIDDAVGEKSEEVVDDALRLSLTEGDVDKTTTGTDSNTTFNYSYPIKYPTGKDGLLYREVTKRIVTIDSSSRSRPTSTTPSSFTLNLSETLKNVVKLKLYSVTIPYSWYTISKDYGSNLFYFKGTSPGIDNALHDIKVEIPPGNYSELELAAVLNEAFSSLRGVTTGLSDYITSININTPGTSMNEMSIEYNPSSLHSTMFTDIRKTYDSNSFKLRFPYHSSVYDALGQRNVDSIPSFFGLEKESYNSFTIRTTRSNINQVTAGGDSHIISTSNNKLRVVRYTPDANGAFIEANIIIGGDYTIELKAMSSAQYITSEILPDLNTKLKTFGAMSTYYINPSGYNYMSIRLDRDDYINNSNTRIMVIYPQTSDELWTGDTSVLGLDYDTHLGATVDISGEAHKYKVLNSILSEEPTIQDRIVVNRELKVKLNCIAPYFNGLLVDGIMTDTELNNYEVTIPLNVSGYTSQGFIDAMNTEFFTLNNSLIDTKNPSGIFRNFGLDPSTNIFDISSNKLVCKFDIIKNISLESYTLDLSGTILGNMFSELATNYHDVDMSANSAIHETLPSPLGYGGDDSSTYLIHLTPKSSSSVRHLPPIDISASYIEEDGNYVFWGDTVLTLANFITSVQKSLKSYEYIDDTIGGTDASKTYIFANSSFTMSDTGTGELDFDLYFNMNLSLSEMDYSLEFTDVNAPLDVSGVWSDSFNLIDSSYNLNLPIHHDSNTHVSTVTSFKTIDADVINITVQNQQIIVEPLPPTQGGEGVYDNDNRNTVTLKIPFGEYTRDELLSAINHEFITRETPFGKIITQNMKMSVVIQPTGEEHIYVDFAVDRTFRADDYKVVFYDSASFSKCDINATSIQNTSHDSTVGYILGYRNKTEYHLITLLHSSIVGVKQLVSDNTTSVNIYTNFSVIMDDYNNNRLGDTIVAGESPDTTLTLPSYAKRTAVACDNSGNLLLSILDKNGNNMTAKQLTSIYSNIESSQASKTDSFTSNKNVLAKDVFAVIPLNTSGLNANEIFVQNGATLQEQERVYFGPVDIQRISVKLMTNKGSLINLNGADWNFSFICEQLVQDMNTTMPS